MINFFVKTTIPEQQLKVYQCFVNYCLNELGIQGLPNIYLLPYKNELQITTGAYDRVDNVYCRAENRALVDCCRTLAHELIHMSQMERGAFKTDEPVQDIGGPIEDEANAVAGQLIKKFVKEFDCRWIYEI